MRRKAYSGGLYSLLILLAGLLTTAQESAAQPPAITVVEVANGFQFGIGVTNAADGSGRLFVVEQYAAIRIWDGAQVLPTPFLDIEPLVATGGEQGLLGLAFHPDYETNGFFYVNYTDTNGDTVVARYTVSAGDPNVANPASAQQVLTFPQTATNHNAGDMHFGPDGYLYIASGDGGGPSCNAQDSTNLLGKMLRIDVDGDDFPADPDANYAIPPSNPFAGVGGAREEIWSLGLRNPWRFSFDRQTGDMYIGDVGEGTWEEVSFQPAASPGGENYGWPWFEATSPETTCASPPGPFASCAAAPFTCPILDLHHNQGNCSMIGGFRYRGLAYAALRGFYFYSDWCGGTLWAAQESGGTWTPFDVATLGFGTTGFGEDEAGELYLVHGDSRLMRVTAAQDSIFEDGFESGNVSNWSATVP